LKSIFNAVAIVCLGLAAPLQLAYAQDVSAYLGFGGAWDGSNNRYYDTFGDGMLHKTPATRGPMAQLGATVYFGKQWGLGAEISRRLMQGDYAGLNYSLSFSSLDVVFRPTAETSKEFEPEYRFGIGDARLHYSFNDQSNCDAIPACPVSTHFQARFAFAGRLYVSNHVFFRPALDVHYVNNFTEFRYDWVPEVSVGVGYSLGRRF
jgi:hypothetical protein